MNATPRAALRPQLQQGLNLTPQLLQTIRLLQLTAPQLELELRQALDRNPLIELDEAEAEDEALEATDAATLEAAAWDELPDPAFLSGGGHAADGGEDRAARIVDGGPSDPRLALLALLDQGGWPARDRALAAWWLDHTDDRGYLEGAPAALAADGAAALDVTAGELLAVRERLLAADWPGVAAADPRECLAAQLDALPGDAATTLARRIVLGHLDLLAAHDLPGLAAALDAEPDAVATALALVLTLRAHPFDEARAPEPHLVPDVVAWKADGRWHVVLDDRALSRVRIVAHCERALADAPGQHAALRGLLDEARWLVRGVAMRNDTLLRTARVLVERQAAFLERGEEAMAPLTLKEVADAIGMHESTVSRITSGKYIQTPRGTLELKRFFAVRLEGAQIGAVAVKAMVRRLIETEPANAPLADDVIAGMLARQGVRIARRTVAKYRDQLHIGPAAARRAARLAATA
ncbi:RNA polymerase factor sigma-54 [Luteimonas pelagia]